MVEAHLARIAAVNPRLNAVVQVTAKSARREAAAADAALARGEAPKSLHGVPVTIKDTLETAGVICTGGTLGRAGTVPKADATAVARLRAAGAIVLGKTNLPELAGALETDNLVYGRTNNPYDLARTPGGSSGGEAAIVAAGGSPLGLGTDAGGSIRVPAHYCGLAALKPTSGRIPRTGQFPRPMGARNSVFHVSLIARRVDDLALALPDPRRAGFLRLHHRRHAPARSPRGRPARIEARLLRRRRRLRPDAGDRRRDPLGGAGLRGGRPRGRGAPPAGRGQGGRHLLRHDPGRRRRRHPRLPEIDRHRPDLPVVRAVAELARGAGHADITAALAAFNRWDALRNAQLAFLHGYDAVLSPVLPYVAPPHGTSFDPVLQRGTGYAQNHNLTGWPAVAVRVGTSPEGMPIGVQVAAHPWREDVALALGRHLEARFGDFSRLRSERSPYSPGVQSIRGRCARMRSK